ncbi:hypothetical protein LI951_02930 [Enterococcus sp. BWT-B8]|uniref:DUF7336 domain-containing protein n=1 Tax=Enterococcus sp. BWT-B8 TaxID=2885157 RepID=UPI001E469924|nr:hypothetical protein [Enterococcus sp. BWT-B8]MCB5951014.1 hypothetical protein [Enterococcus sp. BWT-B8]
MNVYLLQHSYDYEVIDGVTIEETKIIGIYSTRKSAEDVKKIFKEKQEFKRFLNDCFYIDKYQLGKDHWTEGFVTWDGETGTWIDD